MFGIEEAFESGLTPQLRREIRQILFDHLDQIGEAWEEYFKHDR